MALAIRSRPRHWVVVLRENEHQNGTAQVPLSRAMPRFPQNFTDIPTNASVAFAAAAFGALVSNVTEGLPRWAIVVVLAVGVVASAVALLRHVSLRKRPPVQRVVSREERAFRDHWYTVNRDELGQHAAVIQHAALLKWNAKNAHSDDIVEWVRKGAPDPVSRTSALDALVWDDPHPEDTAARLVVEGVFLRVT